MSILHGKFTEQVSLTSWKFESSQVLVVSSILCKPVLNQESFIMYKNGTFTLLQRKTIDTYQEMLQDPVKLLKSRFQRILKNPITSQDFQEIYTKSNESVMLAFLELEEQGFIKMIDEDTMVFPYKIPQVLSVVETFDMFRVNPKLYYLFVSPNGQFTCYDSTMFLIRVNGSLKRVEYIDEGMFKLDGDKKLLRLFKSKWEFAHTCRSCDFHQCNVQGYDVIVFVNEYVHSETLNGKQVYCCKRRLRKIKKTLLDLV